MDPFAGVGSGGFAALGGASPKTGDHIIRPRRFYGCELKNEYHRVAVENCDRAIDGRAWREKCARVLGPQQKKVSQNLFD